MRCYGISQPMTDRSHACATAYIRVRSHSLKIGPARKCLLCDQKQTSNAIPIHDRFGSNRTSTANALPRFFLRNRTSAAHGDVEELPSVRYSPNTLLTKAIAPWRSIRRC
jgi:hypothetical protein